MARTVSRGSSHLRRSAGQQIGKTHNLAAGGEVVKAAAAAQWGGYFGYFSDLDGYLWKVATSD
jgi:uncharacterized protein